MTRHVLGDNARELVHQQVRDDLLGKLDPPRPSIGRRALDLLAEFCFGPKEKRLGRRG